MGLLMKTRQGLELLNSSLYPSIPSSSSSSSSSSFLPLSSSHTQISSHTQPYPSANSILRESTKEHEIIKNKIIELRNRGISEQNGSEISLESALLQMCRHLEFENSKLTETVESLKNEKYEKYEKFDQNGTTHTDLIPHYRLAIVR